MTIPPSGGGNTILANGDNGVEVRGDGQGNSILSNQIFGNAGLGIDLQEDGVTSNDTDDPDTGANNLQNFPVITSAIKFSTGGTIISGTLNSNPNQSYTIQCFVAGGTPSAAEQDPSGNGEGPILVGQDTVQTDANGDAKGDDKFTCSTTAATVVGETEVTATATRLVPDPNDPATLLTRDTSEFSENVVVSRGP